MALSVPPLNMSSSWDDADKRYVWIIAPSFLSTTMCCQPCCPSRVVVGTPRSFMHPDINFEVFQTTLDPTVCLEISIPLCLTKLIGWSWQTFLFHLLWFFFTMAGSSKAFLFGISLFHLHFRICILVSHRHLGFIDSMVRQFLDFRCAINVTVDWQSFDVILTPAFFPYIPCPALLLNQNLRNILAPTTVVPTPMAWGWSRQEWAWCLPMAPKDLRVLTCPHKMATTHLIRNTRTRKLLTLGIVYTANDHPTLLPSILLHRDQPTKVSLGPLA